MEDMYFDALRDILQQLEQFASKNPTLATPQPRIITLQLIEDKNESHVVAEARVSMQFVGTSKGTKQK